MAMCLFVHKCSLLGANKITKRGKKYKRHCLKKMFLRVLLRICVFVIGAKKLQPKK
jgi:hypothetical protein